MTASANIKTPTMEVPLRSGKKPLKEAKKLKRKFAKVTLSQVGIWVIKLVAEKSYKLQRDTFRTTLVQAGCQVITIDC